MKKGKKKGQVSLEFLTTYGWAFLVALIAIGALAYFGVLNPSKYTPKRCNFGSEITCNDFRITNTGPNNASMGNNVSLRLTNQIGSTVQVSAVNFSNSAATKYACNIAGFQWNDGEVKDMSCQANKGVFIKKEKTKLSVAITYYDIISGSSYTHVVNGEVYDEVQ